MTDETGTKSITNISKPRIVDVPFRCCPVRKITAKQLKLIVRRARALLTGADIVLRTSTSSRFSAKAALARWGNAPGTHLSRGLVRPAVIFSASNTNSPKQNRKFCWLLLRVVKDLILFVLCCWNYNTASKQKWWASWAVFVVKFRVMWS